MSDPPVWYWIYGLHDAKIYKISCFEMEYDHKKKNTRRNCFELLLDASRAIYDTQVTCIRLFNYKILSGNADVSGQWWMEDSLNISGRKYLLKLTTSDCKANQELVILFDDAEVRTSDTI